MKQDASWKKQGNENHAKIDENMGEGRKLRGEGRDREGLIHGRWGMDASDLRKLFMHKYSYLIL
jgi:hypothetical protein